MNKEGKNNNTIITYLLIIFMIICQIFRYKTVYIESNKVLEISISNLLYPITFIIILILKNKTDFKEAHNTIIKTCILFLIFMSVISLLNIIPANTNGRQIDMAIKQIFTPSYHIFNKQIIYYPNIIDLITYTLLFYFSHTIMLILYEAMEPYANTFITYFLSMFIPLALDALCFITINDVFNEIEFNTMIIHLTSNFVIVIISTIILSIIYIIIYKKVRFKSSKTV